jgi:hypothetical protein
MENLQDTIKAYVNNQLAGAELADFEAKLATNAALQQEVQTFRDVAFIFQHERLLTTNALLRNLRDSTTVAPEMDFDLDEFLNASEQIPEKTPSDAPNTEESLFKNLGASTKLWWGAGVLFVGVLGVFFFLNKQSEDQEIALKTLSATYTSPQIEVYVDPIKLKENTLFTEATNSYIAKKYVQAIPIFQRHIELWTIKMPDYHAHLYLGISYLMTRQNVKAMEQLNIVIQGDYSVYVNLTAPAKYYYALALMAEGKTESVKDYLTDAQKDPFFKDSATDILQKLAAK